MFAKVKVEKSITNEFSGSTQNKHKSSLLTQAHNNILIKCYYNTLLICMPNFFRLFCVVFTSVLFNVVLYWFWCGKHQYKLLLFSR